MGCAITQGFGGNANPLYKEGGLLGHTGYDIACGFRKPCGSPFTMKVYKVLTKERSGTDGFTGFFGLIDKGGDLFEEILVGHCEEIFVKPGETIERGKFCYLEGNQGLVYQGGVLITDKSLGGGSHTHLQKRLVKRVSMPKNNMQYLSVPGDNSIYQDESGFVYEVIGFDNGYNGCVTIPQDELAAAIAAISLPQYKDEAPVTEPKGPARPWYVEALLSFSRWLARFFREHP